MAPVHVKIPYVPLTDTEIIVYFFQSLSRPIVALRLYSRGWGPASICEILNTHRLIIPEYLRNTCSVKCTTAIKKGNKLYESGWEANHKAVFGIADDMKATDLMRDDPSAADFLVRDMAENITKHPKLEQDAGVFTRCVQYCVHTGAAYTMSNVHELAEALQLGREPDHPPEPDLPAFKGPKHFRAHAEQPNASQYEVKVEAVTPESSFLSEQDAATGEESFVSSSLSSAPDTAELDAHAYAEHQFNDDTDVGSSGFSGHQESEDESDTNSYQPAPHRRR